MKDGLGSRHTFFSTLSTATLEGSSLFSALLARVVLGAGMQDLLSIQRVRAREDLVHT